jgi:hypothetical protein
VIAKLEGQQRGHTSAPCGDTADASCALTWKLTLQRTGSRSRRANFKIAG